MYVELAEGVRMIKLRKLRLVEHVAHMGDVRNACRFWLENQNGETTQRTLV
jgi:hypothetical protein